MSTAIVQTNTDLTIQRGNVVDMVKYLPQMRELAQVFRTAAIVNSQLISDEQVLAVMFKSIELNVPMTTALEKMSVINKNIMMEAELVLALIYRSGLCAAIDIKDNASSCSVTMARNTPKIKHTSTFSLEDAKRAGLAEKDVWRRYPKTMVRWRAITECAKIVFADVLGGMLDNVPLMVKIPQPDYTSEPSVPDDASTDAASEPSSESSEPKTESTPEPTPMPTAQTTPEPQQTTEPARPLQPADLKRKLLSYAARAGSVGDVPQQRNWTRNNLRWVTIHEEEIATLLRYFFGKSKVDELSIAECKAIAKWLNVTKNGDMLLADPHSVSEFHLVMRARGEKRSAEQQVFDDEPTSNATTYNTIAE